MKNTRLFVQASALAASLIAGGCDGAPGASDFDLDAIPALTATEELRVGSTDDPEAGFTRPSMADVDRDGALYVFEGFDSRIRVYDSAGRPLRRMGGRGSGPGEFQTLARFGVQGDTVWAYYFQARRITCGRCPVGPRDLEFRGPPPKADRSATTASHGTPRRSRPTRPSSA